MCLFCNIVDCDCFVFVMVGLSSYSPSVSMSRSEVHLSQSPLKANAMTFPVTVYSFVSSDYVYESQNYLTTAKYKINIPTSLTDNDGCS